MIRMIIPCFLFLFCSPLMAESVTYTCEQKYSVNIDASGHTGTIKVYKNGKPAAITKSDKFFIDLVKQAYDMNGNTVTNYSAYKGFDHSKESVTVSDFYTLITQNDFLDRPSKKAKLQTLFPGRSKPELLSCDLGLDFKGVDLSGIDFSDLIQEESKKPPPR
ncbi:hypothetical protein [Buttiauxella sp. S04-F03]|uniref:hypothetical protein n=1 Tax=Buttiauxella sp. S04-F03 TaxID=2904525 RepID=UPI001E470CAB|nr:hypothetical protein [Buttiauxella sp. S04-F03]MCE0812932.1 hypothetical protein [Buttiauxella sp. S04-F03]